MFDHAAGRTVAGLRLNRVGAVMADFARERSGSIAIVFGLMSMLMFMMMGLAVDYSRWHHARDQTMAAIDAAVLAGGRALQLAPGDENAALAVAQRYYQENTRHRADLQSDTITFKTEDEGLAITAEGSAYIATTLLNLAGIDRLSLFEVSGAEYSKAVIATGGNAGSNIEISLMLDTSGSMDANNKFEDMQEAASDLVDIVVWADQSKYTSKVAIAPFSGDMRVPADVLDRVRGAGHASSVSYTYACGRRRGDGTCTATYQLTACVSERKGDDRYTDAAPGPGNYVMPVYNGSGECTQPEENSMMALSSDKSAIIEKIAGMSPGGSTAGHLGTAWAWYALSPSWNTALSSSAADYGDDKTEKIAILMTDGEYNTQYDGSGVRTTASGAGPAANGTSRQQAESLCDSMKAAGVTVYTVGFDLGGMQSAIDTLEYCASDPGKFYNAEDGEQLKQAFRDIALKLSTLYLSR